MPNEIATLNSSERSKLRLCEAAIEKHLATFLEVGNALAEIQSGKLYRETHKTFEAYVKAKWDFAKSHTYRLIAAAEVAKNVPHGGQIPAPTSERQVRPLTELPAEQQSEAWKAAVEKAKEAGEPVTAAIVEEVVEELKPCPHCGGTEKDEDGDCMACHEPARKIKSGKAKTVKEATAKDASPADVAKAQIKIWSDTVGRWLGKSPSIDELRASFPGKRGDVVVKLATDLYESLKLWEKAIH